MQQLVRLSEDMHDLSIHALVGALGYGAGPSLNPAVTFAWAVHHRQHALLEHLLVFRVAPIAGGMLDLVQLKSREILQPPCDISKAFRPWTHLAESLRQH